MFHYVERTGNNSWTESLAPKAGYYIYSFTKSYTCDVEFYAANDDESIQIIANSHYKPCRLLKIINNKINTVYLNQ